MDLQTILIVLAIGAGVGLTLLGGSARARRSRAHDPYRVHCDEQATLANSATGKLHELEVRIFDYGREVEARIDLQLRVLDQLIVDADREIARLEALLAESRCEWVTQRDLSRQEQQRCFAMREAGFTVEEIAYCLNATADTVQQALDEWQAPGSEAA
ncbi:hypothetical protein GC163_12725 [bacterium]|nr:hypothetical protein [bacterium]